MGCSFTEARRGWQGGSIDIFYAWFWLWCCCLWLFDIGCHTFSTEIHLVGLLYDRCMQLHSVSYVYTCWRIRSLMWWSFVDTSRGFNSGPNRSCLLWCTPGTAHYAFTLNRTFYCTWYIAWMKLSIVMHHMSSLDRTVLSSSWCSGPSRRD